MKELAVLILICVVLGIAGCVQPGQGQPTPTPGTGNNTITPTITPTGNNLATPATTPAIPGTVDNLTTGNAALYNDVESIAKEAAGIDTTGLENAIVPVTADDISID